MTARTVHLPPTLAAQAEQDVGGFIIRRIPHDRPDVGMTEVQAKAEAMKSVQAGGVRVAIFRLFAIVKPDRS